MKVKSMCEDLLVALASCRGNIQIRVVNSLMTELRDGN